MPKFDTPQPINVTIELSVGDVRITASDRTDTVVEVTPNRASKAADVKAAEQTRVEFSQGRLLILTPRSWKRYTPFGGGEAVNVAIELPAGSRINAESAVGDVGCEGRLGECRFNTSVGNVYVDQTGPLHVNTSGGNVTVDRIVGRGEITGSGQVRIREIDGPAVIKNLNGATWVGEVTGDLRCNAANGDISVERALGAVIAKTANGAVRIGEVVRGAIEISTANGELEVGIREGTAAMVDAHSHFGSVRNSLTTTHGPEPSDQTVEVRARTSYGDIVIRRSSPNGGRRP